MLTIEDVKHRAAPKLPVVLPPGVLLTQPVVRSMSLLSIYLEVETVCSTLFETVLTFDDDGVPTLDVLEAHWDSFVSMGVRAVFDSHGWVYSKV